MYGVDAAQKRYAAELFSPLKRALQRRTFDSYFIPSVLSPHGHRDPIINFANLHTKVDRITEAMTGDHVDFILADRSPMRSDQRPSRNPPLPPMLSERLFSILAGMEAEVLDLSKSIELNNYRRVRNDPRWRSEEELGAWRSDFLKRWIRIADQLMGRVNIFWDIERRKLGSRL